MPLVLQGGGEESTIQRVVIDHQDVAHAPRVGQVRRGVFHHDARATRAERHRAALTADECCHTLYDMATKRTSKVLTVSLPPDDADDFERIATDEGRNRSELFREMLRVYDIYRETTNLRIAPAVRGLPGGEGRDPDGGRRRAADPELARLRVVLDTNILISAFIFPGGPPEAAYRAALDGRVELVTSPPLLAELGRVLADKFGWEPPLAAEAVTQVARMATVVRPEGSGPGRPG